MPGHEAKVYSVIMIVVPASRSQNPGPRIEAELGGVESNGDWRNRSVTEPKYRMSTQHRALGPAEENATATSVWSKRAESWTDLSPNVAGRPGASLVGFQCLLGFPDTTPPLRSKSLYSGQ